MVSHGAVCPRSLPLVTPLAFIDITLLVGFDVDKGPVMQPRNTGSSGLYNGYLQTGNVAVFARAGADHPQTNPRARGGSSRG